MRQFTLLHSYEILYDKNLKGCVYKRLQISDLSGLKKDEKIIFLQLLCYISTAIHYLTIHEWCLIQFTVELKVKEKVSQKSVTLVTILMTFCHVIFERNILKR